jgi:hypothetical protein
MRGSTIEAAGRHPVDAVGAEAELGAADPDGDGRSPVVEGVDDDGDRPTFDVGVHAATAIATATVRSRARARPVDRPCVIRRPPLH